MSNDPTDPPTTLTQRNTWKRVLRLLHLMDLLRTRAWSSAELASWLRVGQRAVQRDIQDLLDAQIGVQRGANNTYHLSTSGETLEPVQALAVHMAARLLYHHAATDNKQYLRALDKLARQLPEAVGDIARRSAQSLRPQLESDEAFAKVALAWFEHRVIAFEYHAPGKAPERRELAVYFVEVSRNNLAPYAIGFERLKSGAIRTFKLSRMRHVTTLADTYEVPGDFDPQAFLTDAWGVIGGQDNVVTVTLRFSSEAAYRLLEGGYPSLTVEPGHDPQGRLTVKVRAGVDNTGLPRELMPWILGWGPRVEVLKPQSVRTHWLQEVRATLARYGDDGN